MRSSSSQCFGDDGSLGKTVWTISEDRSGVLRIGADSGVWRWKPGPPLRESAEPRDVSGLALTEDAHILASTFGGGLTQLDDRPGARPAPYPMQPPIGRTRPLAGRELNANRMLVDRDGGVWIGTTEHGLVHSYRGRTDVFTKSDGLSGDIVNFLFEDREGNIWVATTGGIDRFREFAVTTISSREGLASDAVVSVLGDRDGRLLERYPPDVTQARQRTMKIVELGTLASEIIDRLRSLYKKEAPKRVPLAVNEVIGEMAELLRGQAMRHGSSLRTDLADDLPTVVADRSRSSRC